MFNALLAEDLYVYNCLITDLHESKKNPQAPKHTAKILWDARRWQVGAEQTDETKDRGKKCTHKPTQRAN